MTLAGLIDAHQHFWRLDMPGHEWPGADLPEIHRDFLPADLRQAAAGTDIAATVLVQSQPTDADTDWLCELAAGEPLVGAVVGWADLAAAGAPDRIAALACRPKLRGLRPMLQAIPDTEWILDEALAPAIAAMIAHGLSFDALIQPRHLPVLARLAARWPDLPIVVDHGAKPRMASGDLEAWRDGITVLGSISSVWCKLSGLRTEQAIGQPADALAPLVSHLVESFGDRLMWGSDWPVLAVAGDTPAEWLAAARRLSGLDAKGEARLFAGAARSFYRL